MSDFDGKISRIVNGTLFFDALSMYGKVEEVNLPEIVASMTDHKVLGMWGKIELPSGADKMEASFKLNGPLAEISAASADVSTSHEFTFRGYNQIFSGQTLVSERPYVCIFKGTFKKSPIGNSKQHENIELMYNINVTYTKLTINGVNILEFDVVNNILSTNGVDTKANYRAILGL